MESKLDTLDNLFIFDTRLNDATNQEKTIYVQETNNQNKNMSKSGNVLDVDWKTADAQTAPPRYRNKETMTTKIIRNLWIETRKACEIIYNGRQAPGR